MARVLVGAGGDVGSAVAHLLLRSGHEVVITTSRCQRRRGAGWPSRTRSSTAPASSRGVRGRRVDAVAELSDGGADVLLTIAELGDVLAALLPDVLVDARMRKRAQPETQRGSRR